MLSNRKEEANMAIYKKKGFHFDKHIAILNKSRTRILFGFIAAIGINADEPQYFRQTANWIFIGGGFNLKPENQCPGLYYRWNIKQTNG